MKVNFGLHLRKTYGEVALPANPGRCVCPGLQGDLLTNYIKNPATPKHSGLEPQENERFGKNVQCDERYLFEYEFFPFRACVREARAESIMASYTAINGVPSSVNPWLLTDVLRRRWGFKGYVVSDCGAISHVVDAYRYVNTPEAAIAAALNAGCDLEGGYFATYPDLTNNYLKSALDKGLATQQTIDTALTRVLIGRFKLGMFDPEDRVPYSKIPESVICSPEHIAQARKLACESIVLLKNDPVNAAPLLPIDADKVRRIAIVGPNAEAANLGDYSGVPRYTVTALQGLKARAERAGISVTAYPWQDGTAQPVPTSALVTGTGAESPGLTGRYYASPDLTGEPSATRVDRQLNFDWAHIEPDPFASGSEFSVAWNGKIKSRTAGNYTFTVTADGGVDLFVDNAHLISKWQVKSAKRVTYSGVIHFEGAGEHRVDLRYHHAGGETGLVFGWTLPSEHSYVSALKDADLVIAVMGIDTTWETEGKDRTTLRLPPEQEDFLRQAATNNPKIVAVTESGSALAMPWAAAHLPAIVQAWYPGQEGGNAIADILFGDANPSGRLPLTFYADDSQVRPMEEYDLTKGRTYMYLQDKPEYAFGHGLSYTSFKYGSLKLSKSSAAAGDKITATVDVTNTGSRAGAEVVQGYVTARRSSVPMPKRQLWAFERVNIPQGETRSVTLVFDTANFGHWDKASQSFIAEPGEFNIQAGSSSDEIRTVALLGLK